MKWQTAQGVDIPAIRDLSRRHFQAEAQELWNIDEHWFGLHVTQAIVSQFWQPGSAWVVVARDHQGQLRGWSWVQRGQTTIWSRDEMAEFRMIHLDMSLPARVRRDMILDLLDQAQAWCQALDIPILVSSTMRSDQAGFLRLHQRAGFECRGSICYRRIGAPVSPVMPESSGS